MGTVLYRYLLKAPPDVAIKIWAMDGNETNHIWDMGVYIINGIRIHYKQGEFKKQQCRSFRGFLEWETPESSIL